MKRLSDEELAELDGYVRGVVFFGSKDPLRHIPGILAEVRELRALGAEVLECYGEGAEPNLGKALARLSAALERGKK